MVHSQSPTRRNANDDAAVRQRVAPAPPPDGSALYFVKRSHDD